MADGSADGKVIAVSCSSAHAFSKHVQRSINIVKGLGVTGDAHAGTVVQHRSRVKQRERGQANLRQVHIVHSELHDELRAQGFELRPGAIGENILTRDVDLLSLPRGTRLQLGADAEVEVAGLRNPCKQLDDFSAGLMDACLGRDADGELVRKAGVMCVATASGVVAPGDAIRIELPPEPHEPLACV